ncbi:hypothetical protein L7F22_065882 [Adiantum nelumboides]|nr:hypothetical protein [Adiantum nelumboides]
MPTIHPEMGSFSFSPHQVESRSSPLLLQDTGISASIGGHIYSPVVPLPNVYVSSKWFEPNNRPDAFDLAISFNKRNDLASRNECSKDVGLPNDTNINPKTQQSSTSGSFKDGSDSTPNNPDGKSNSKVIEEPSHDSFVLPSEVDHTSVEALCFLLDKCTVDKDIAGGRFLHLLIISNGFDFVPELGDNLIRFFGLCASVLEADRLFSKLSVLGLSAWHTIMSAHAVHGDDEKVFQLYIEMVHASTAPNSFIFTRVVNSCASLKALKRGETVHKDIIYFGLQSDLFVANALIGFYSKCGSLSKARHVFVMLPEKNVVVWSSIIGAFIQEGYLEQSLELFREMEEHDFQPNEYTYSSLISACGNAANVVDGLSLHSQFVKSGLNLDSHMASSLIDMYAKCGCMIEARDVFDDLSNPALTCWSTLIAGYTRIEQDHTALKVYESMESKGCTPNSSTLCCSLRACGNLKAVDKGRAVHDQVIAIGLDSDEYIRSNLIDMYCQCGCLDDAKSVFDHWPSPNIVLWGALMAGHVAV